jgi:zinc-binding in reverse transcriptase
LGVSNVQLISEKENKIIWRWNTSGVFTVHSFYIWLNDGCTLSKDYHILRHSKLPLKIHIFLWLVRKNRILTKDNLVKHGWQENTSCVFCLEKETCDHLFVICPLVNFIW